MNQFPCDIPSRERRKNFLKERYPFAEYLRFGIIGDDDLISLTFIKDYWAWPIILEKDQRITKIIRDASSRFKVYDIDICNTMKIKTLPRVQTFMTDPPYTFHGALAFITAGLHMLTLDNSIKEFYVIINPMMIGRHLEKIQRILINADIYLTDVLENFSQYELPRDFMEKKRADNFLSSVKVNPNAVHYSSSSSLYVFKTRMPNIQKIEQGIDHNQLYNHYA